MANAFNRHRAPEALVRDTTVQFGMDVAATDHTAAKGWPCAANVRLKQKTFCGFRYARDRLGYDLGLGIGIAKGFGTIGGIGFEGRWDYDAIGTVTNLAPRLCGEAKGGEILASARLATEWEGQEETDDLPPLTLKGFARPVPALRLIRFTS